jgi:hypothetical protein
MSWWNCMPLGPVTSYGSSIGGDGLPLLDFLPTHLQWTRRLITVNGFLVAQDRLFFVFTEHYLSYGHFKFLFRCFLKHDSEFSHLANTFQLQMLGAS